MGCCGNSFLYNLITFGSGSSTPPCTPTSTEQITGGNFDNPADWPFQDGGAGQLGVITGGQLTWPNDLSIEDGYFQSLPSLDSTKNYVFTVTKTDVGVDPSPLVVVYFQSSDGYSAFYNITSVNGTYTNDLEAGVPQWSLGPSAGFANYGLGPGDFGILIVVESAILFGDGFLEEISLTLEECI